MHKLISEIFPDEVKAQKAEGARGGGEGGLEERKMRSPGREPSIHFFVLLRIFNRHFQFSAVEGSQPLTQEQSILRFSLINSDPSLPSQLLFTDTNDLNPI
jgi:hypothetical protein